MRSSSKLLSVFIDKAFKLLNWKATTSMKDGIKKTVDWARNNNWYLNNSH